MQPLHHSSIQSSTEQHERIGDKNTSNKKSHTISRPFTAFTNATRHSSVNQRRGRRRQPAGTTNPQKTLVAKELEDPTLPSRSESSSRGRYQKYQTRYSHNRTSEPKEPLATFSQNARNSGQ